MFSNYFVHQESECNFASKDRNSLVIEALRIKDAFMPNKFLTMSECKETSCHILLGEASERVPEAWKFTRLGPLFIFCLVYLETS